LQENKLGKLKQLEIHFDRFRPTVNKAQWREKNEKGSEVLFDLGSHLLDQILFLFGYPLKYQADVAVLREFRVTDDYFHLCLFYENLRVILHASTSVTKPQAYL